jgi:hypothetical protein
MSHRNTKTYVQRKMNNILRDYSWVKTYIDDVIVFSETLKKHLEHLSQLFALFKTLNITLKAKKTYLEYFSISLLEQKVNNLNLIIAENKLKAIVKLISLKILKNLEKYLEIIEWLRDYVTYYAQKTKSLQERKTNLLKKESIKKKFQNSSISKFWSKIRRQSNSMFTINRNRTSIEQDDERIIIIFVNYTSMLTSSKKN